MIKLKDILKELVGDVPLNIKHFKDDMADSGRTGTTMDIRHIAHYWAVKLGDIMEMPSGSSASKLVKDMEDKLEAVNRVSNQKDKAQIKKWLKRNGYDIKFEQLKELVK